MSSFARTLLAVAWKDLAAEWRSREILSATLVFSILVIFIYNFALDLEVTLQSDLAAGILWVTFVFAGTLGLNRSMVSSWKLETSAATHPLFDMPAVTLTSGMPMLPATAVSLPPAFSASPRRETVVLFPVEPVIARKAASPSPRTG